MDSHRLIHLAGQQGIDKQNDLVEELFLGYFTQAKYVGDRYVDDLRFSSSCSSHCSIVFVT